MKYEKEFLSGRIIDEIREQEEITGNINFEIEFDNCVATGMLFYSLWRDCGDVLQLDEIDIHSCVLFFEDSETDFNLSELKELEQLVKLYF